MCVQIMFVYMYTHAHRCSKKPKKGVEFPEARVTGGCELMDVGAGI